MCLFTGILLHARSGYNFRILTGSYLGQYNFLDEFNGGAELLYDHNMRSCVSRSRFYGAALSGIWSYRFNEYGFKTYWAPANWQWMMSRNFHSNPYFFAQVNYKQKHISTGKISDWNFRPGIGFISINKPTKGFCFRYGIQAGYAIGDTFLPANKRIILEGRLGIGFSLPAKQKKTDTL